MCTKFSSPSSQVVHNGHLVVRKKTPPKLDVICENYWLLNFAPKFEDARIY